MDYIEGIKKEIERLKEENKLIIVEGKKDIISLMKLGLNNVIEIKGPLFENIEKIEEDVAILTDMDKKGKELYSRLKKQLQKRGIKVDDKLRNLLFKAKLSHVEGLAKFLQKNGNFKRRKD